MSTMGDLYTVHECEHMDVAELQGMQLLMVGAAEGALTSEELAAVFASPVLRAWAVRHIASYGKYCIREYGEKRMPVSVPAYLGALRQELSAMVAVEQAPRIAAPKRRVRQNGRVPKSPKPAKYLSLTEVADRIGVKTKTLSRYALPEPDALIGATRGWKPETIDKWNANRPGRGKWSKTPE